MWSYSWMTAVCTGLGALPFLLVDDVSKFWFGICNATAGGMMIAASAILAWESLSAADDLKLAKLVIGCLAGVIFVRVSRSKLEQYEDLKLAGIEGMNARKALLLMAVMTIHSLSEGIGIGVAFSGSAGQRLGTMISSSLAPQHSRRACCSVGAGAQRGPSKGRYSVEYLFQHTAAPSSRSNICICCPVYVFFASWSWLRSWRDGGSRIHRVAPRSTGVDSIVLGHWLCMCSCWRHNDSISAFICLMGILPKK